MINWKVRISNPTFWLTSLPLLLLIIQQICEIIGYHLEITSLSQQLQNLINLIFQLFAAIGIVVDMTTKGIGDSERALSYVRPN